MGKYLIKSSESKDIVIKKSEDLEGSKNLLTDNEVEEEEEEEEAEAGAEAELAEGRKEESSTLGKDSLNPILCVEGGRWNIKNNKEHKKTERRNKKRNHSGTAASSSTTAAEHSSLIININKKLRVLFKLSKSCLIIYLLLITMTLVSLTIASPTPPSLTVNNKNNKNIINHNNRNNNNNNDQESSSSLSNYDMDDINFVDNIQDSYEDDVNSNRDLIDSQELDIIRKSIMQDLGLKKIPDPSKANVSQTEYEKAHREYLKRVELSSGQDQRTRRRLHVYYPADKLFPYDNLSSRRNTSSSLSSSSSSPHSIYFPVQIPSENHAVDHAALRILIGGYENENENEDETENENENENDEVEENYDYDESREENMLTVSIYQRKVSSPRSLISRQRVSVGRYSPRWAEFDSTEAVASWVHDGVENLGFEIEVKEEEEEEEDEDEDDEIRRRGTRRRRRRRRTSQNRSLKSSSLSAALNVFTISASSASSSDNNLGSRNRRATPDQLMSLHKGRRTECKGQNKKCCRHQMTVIFKDLKGFEFIIQPKDFDAGYCKGRCPPRYNPAHHHALLQSLIWKEDRKKAPRPCCAPSKLTELEILYFDENDATKLKVSNWKNMRVVECACS